MASFPICPLIDQKSFLGITNDSTPGCIIVTLGKKIIIRFRLSDQKQLSSWTTKDKLSTPVFFDDEREEYFAVFNGELISRWSKDKEYIQKRVGKYKLPWLVDSIHCISGTRPVLLFKSGVMALLGTDNKKSIAVLKENVFPEGEICETKAYSFSGHSYLCFLVKKECSIFLNFTPILESNNKAFSLDIVRKKTSSTLNCFTVIEEKSQLMTLWSDGCLFAYDLDETTRNLDEFPGRCFMTFTNINCSLPCVMTALDNHVAVYGADANGEGAKVVWVEASFGVVQNSLHLKLYSNPPHMWKVGSSYLITPVGQNLMVIPYKLKNTPKLDSLLAAHCPAEPNITQFKWENIHKPIKPKNQVEADLDIIGKVNDGYPEYVLSQEVIVKLLEQGKVKEAISQLSNLTDLSDKCVIDTVICCLNSKQKNSKELLSQVLSFPLLYDNETLSYIRDKLGFDSAIILFDILSEQLKIEPENETLFKWLTLLLDSHYQQYLLTKDESVMNRIMSLKEQTSNLITNMVELQELYKLLTGSLKTKVVSKTSVQYSVDKFRLF